VHAHVTARIVHRSFASMVHMTHASVIHTTMVHATMIHVIHMGHAHMRHVRTVGHVSVICRIVHCHIMAGVILTHLKQ